MPNTTSQSRSDLFSRFVNWLSNSGQDKPLIQSEKGGRDPLSRLMNRISG